LAIRPDDKTLDARGTDEVHLNVDAEPLVAGIDNNQRAVFFGPEGDTSWVLRRLRSEIDGYSHYSADIRDRETILRLMSDNELQGVIAHELGHVLHRDILISSVAAMLAGTITFLARMAFWFGGSRDERDRGSPIAAIAMMILAPIAAMLIQMAISRSREYDADAASAKYVGSPYPLIGGLQKLESWSKRIPMDASPATAHMFIIKPFTGQSFMKMFSTHPSTEDRIARLQAQR